MIHSNEKIFPFREFTYVAYCRILRKNTLSNEKRRKIENHYTISALNFNVLFRNDRLENDFLLMNYVSSG